MAALLCAPAGVSASLLRAAPPSAGKSRAAALTAPCRPLRTAVALPVRAGLTPAASPSVPCSASVSPARRGASLRVRASAGAHAVSAASASEPAKETGTGKLFAVTVFLWYFFNAVFAIFNKRTLNVFPYPWLLSWVQLACGAAFMLLVWALRIYPAPKVTLPMVRALLPVTALHLIGHVAGCASYNFSSISFMQIVKAAEPVVSVLCLTLLYGQRFSAGVWLSLVPIVAGVAVVSATEVNFAVAGFLTAMLSNFAFVFRNIKSKEAQTDIGLGGINLYAWMSILGTAMLLPISLAMEGHSIGAAVQGAQAAFAGSGAVPFLWLGKDTGFLAFLLTGGLFYHLYNQTSYMCLTGISPLTYSIANTVKRVVVILAGIAVFRNPIPPINAVASAVAIAGTWFYAQAETKAKEAAKAAK